MKLKIVFGLIQRASESITSVRRGAGGIDGHSYLIKTISDSIKRKKAAPPIYNSFKIAVWNSYLLLITINAALQSNLYTIWTGPD